jgi:Bacterial regulatory proteins, tetR family
MSIDPATLAAKEPPASYDPAGPAVQASSLAREGGAEGTDCHPRQDLNSHVEDIARAAGLSRQTVYAHFPSREVLLDAVAGA